MTTAGDISNTQGAAVGEHSTAQTTTVNVAGLSNRELTIEMLDRMNVLALNVERLSAKLDHVTDRTATALVNVQDRMYQMGKSAERQQAHDATDRHTGQAEHAEQHDEVNRRLAALEELMRAGSAQARQDRLVFGLAMVALIVFQIGRSIGWW